MGAAGWTVRRISSDDVYEHPSRLIALSPPPNVPGERSSGAIAHERPDRVAFRTLERAAGGG